MPFVAAGRGYDVTSGHSIKTLWTPATMDANTLLQLATLISVIAAVVGLIISIRAYKRQVSSLFLLEYTKRVDDIMRTLPLNLWVPHMFPQEELAEPNKELRLHAMRCINFISQLYYFSRKRYIPRDIWRKREARYPEILKGPLFLHLWKKVAPMYVVDGAFCRYVEKTQQLGEDPARTPLDKSLAAER